MEKHKNPCRKDCKNRSHTCHSVCAAYLEWRKINMETGSRQHSERRKGDITTDTLIEWYQKRKKRMRRK